MRYNLNFMLLLLGASILGVSVAIEQRIDKRSARRRAEVAASMEISNLDFLRPYVCSPTNGRRQEYLETRTTTITIPLEDFADLWTQLSIILAQMAKIMMDASIAFPSPVGISAPTVVNSAGAAISVALPTTFDTIPPLASLTSDMDLAATTTPNQDLSFNTTLIGIPPSIVQVTNTESMTSTSTTNIGAPLKSGESFAQDSQPDLASLSDTAPAVQLLVSILQTTVEDSAPANTSQPAEISPLAPTALGTTANISPTTPALLSSDPPYCEDEVTTSTTVYVTTTLTSIVIDTDTAQTGVGAISTANTPAPPGQALVETRPASSHSSFRSSPSSSPSTSGYTFNAQSSKNVVVYFGQTAATSSTTLLAQCADSNIDIVILAFIVQNTYQGSPYPLINFGAACGGQTSEMSASAPGLLSCPDLASMISECQKTYGKKVMLSIGGATGSIIFATEAEAEEFATVLWQLFGPPGQIDVGLRPFGDVEVDGFDIDNENNHPAYYINLASTFRNVYATSPTKTYYLSSAPQCPLPDVSNPTPMLLLCDFVYIQFYNNPTCEIGSSGFTTALQDWSAVLSGTSVSKRALQPNGRPLNAKRLGQNARTKSVLRRSMVTPKMFLGAPAWSAAGPTAYTSIGGAQGIESVVEEVVALGLSNFGGVMFWDGAEGLQNVENGKDIIAWAKEGLDG